MKGLKLASDIKFALDYAKWLPEKERLETWDEAVDRVMSMHEQKFAAPLKANPKFRELFELTREAYKEKLILGSNRVLQFAGEPILKHNSRVYNCLASYCDRPKFFQEAMYWLLSGCGVGYSVQFCHVNHLPKVGDRDKGAMNFVVEDSCEGWADAFGVLLSSYLQSNQPFPEYAGYRIKFDFSKIRPKGAMISGGFKAPGPDGLERALKLWERLLDDVVGASDTLKPIHCYDMVCHMADAVLSGGVRRSATICLFSPDDEEMMNAKAYTNYNISAGLNTQRARSNNSVVLVRSKTSKEDFTAIMDKIKDWGEPGFYFVDHEDQTCNPCIHPDSILRVEGKEECVQFKDVNEGDKIWSNEGWTTIIKKWSTGIRPVYRYTTDSGRYIICTDNHPVISNGKRVPIGQATHIDKAKPVPQLVGNYKMGERDPACVSYIEKDYSLDEKAGDFSDKINVIEYIGDEEVFDITVDNDTNTFWCGGLNVSNCVEIGMWARTEAGVSGWQGCNLCTGNGSAVDSVETYLRMCTALGVIGTLQASYTDFKYVDPASKEIFDREALLGCGICGWMNSPDILLDKDNMKMGAELILAVNEEVAGYIGINKTARATCSKPDGNTGVLLQAASGCHGEEAPHYFRLMQINKENEISKYLKDKFPFLVEESVWSKGNTDYVLYVAVDAKPGSIFKDQLYGTKQLEVVKSIQNNWVEHGTRVDRCVQPFLRHNVSNTVQVPEGDWGIVGDYLFENSQYFSGVSFLGIYGAKDYKQAPFTPVLMPEDMLKRYGNGFVFASGLIVDGLHDFDDDLWDACNAVVDPNYVLDGTRRQVLLKKEWIRRAKSFAKKFFKGNLKEMVYCLKDVHLFHKWSEVNREFKGCNIFEAQLKPEYVDADTLGSAGCVGGVCEMPAEYLERMKNK